MNFLFLPGKNKKRYLLIGWMDEKWEKNRICWWLWVSEGLIPACEVKNAALYEKKRRLWER